MSEDYDHLRCS